MKLIIYTLLITFAFVAISAQRCPQGGDIYEWGISQEGQTAVVNAHNKYRQMIMDGTVPGQPQGKNLKTMVYDRVLGEKGRSVSQTCQMQHVLAQDDRWWWVGQNLYIEWSSVNENGQNWDKAVESWYNEYKDFVYPNQSNGVTGHYTQVVWADSDHIGCDFIQFYDVTQPSYPYAKLYTCNYGPGGNVNNDAPYELA